MHDYGGYPFTYQLAKELAEEGFQVTYVYSQSTQLVQRILDDIHDQALVVEGVKLSTPFDKYNYLQRLQAEYTYGRLVARRIQQVKPDIVISANTPLDAQRLIQKAAHQANSQVIFWMQDVIGLAMRKALKEKFSLLGSLVGAYYQWLEKKLVQRSHKVVLIADNFNPLMDQWRIPRQRVQVIPNWAPVDQITPQPKSNDWSRGHGLDGFFCFVYTGILGLKHNPALLLNLAGHYRDDPAVRVVVVSSGGGMTQLYQAKAEQNLTNLVLMDFQPASVYPQVLASADVLLGILKPDASAYSVPSKVLTYLCAGRPVLLSLPLSNLAAQTVQKSKAGFVAAPEDVVGFLNNADILYKDEAFRLRCGLSAREYAVENFNIDVIKSTFLHMISDNKSNR